MYIEGDCHEVIKTIEDNSIDLIYCSPPYGITKSKWDKPLDFNIMFPQLFRVLKPTGTLILHCSMPFTYTLLEYKIKPKYNYIWIKNNSTGHFLAKRQPMRQHEEVLIYYNKNNTYNPQMKGVEQYTIDYNKSNDYYCNKYKKGKSTHTGRYPTTILEYPIRREKTGITRCDDMIDYFIKTYSNETETVLDFTCHNKTVGNRCEVLNRKYIGIDINLQ